MNFFDQFDTEEQPSNSNFFDQFDEGYKPPVEHGDFVRGATVAAKQLPQLGYGLIAGAGAIGESVLGEGGVSSDIKNYGVRKYQEAGADIAKDSKETDSLTYSWDQAQQGNYGAMVDWLQYGLGYGGVQALEALASAGIGSVVGKITLKGAAEQLASGMVKKQAAEIAATEAGKKMAADQLQKVAVASAAAKIGSMVGVGAQAYGMEGGEILGGLAEQSAERGTALSGAEIAKGLGATLAAGTLEFAGDKLGVDVMLGKSRLFSPAAAMEGIKGKAARAGIALPTTAIAEGSTEYLQTGLEEWGQGKEQNILPFNQSEEAQKHALDAAGLGAVGGGGMAVVGGALSKPEQKPTTPADILNSASTDEAIDNFGTTVDESLTDPLLTAEVSKPGLIQRDFGALSQSATGFGKMDEFANLVSQEQADIAQKRDELFQRQALQRESNLESVDNRVAGAWQVESSQNRLALLDAAYSDQSISNPAEKFLADLGRQFPNNPIPTPEEKRLIAKRESARQGFANYTEPKEPQIPSAPNEMEGLVKEKKPVTQANVAPNLAKVDEAIAAGYTLDKSRNAPALKSQAGKLFLLSKSQYAYYKQRMDEQNAARNSVNEAKAVSTGMGNAGQGVKVPAQTAEDISKNTSPEITSSDVRAVQDIPTTEKMAKAIEYVGEEEFKRMAEAKIKKYRPSNTDQEAMLVEATAIEILAKNRAGQSNESLPQPSQPDNSTPSGTVLDGRTTNAGNEPGNAPAGVGNNLVPGVLATGEEGGKSQSVTTAVEPAGEQRAGIDTAAIRQNVEQLIKLRRNARELKLGSHLEIAVTKAKKVLESGTGNAADFKKLAKQFAQKKDKAGRVISKGDEQIRSTLLSVANALEQVAPGARKQQKPSNDLLARIKQFGGIDRSQALDVTGEERGVGGWKFAFKNGGKSLDDLATMLADEGFNIDTSDVDGGVQQLRDMIRSHINGERNFKVRTQEQQAESLAEQRDMDDMITRAEELGIKWKGLDHQQLKDAIYMAVDAIEMAELDAAENPEEVAELSDAIYDGIVNDGSDTDFTVSTPEEVAAWLGEDNGQEGNAKAVQGAVRKGSEASPGRDGGTDQQEAGTGQEALQSYTAEELASREEARTKAEAEAKKAQDEAERKAQAERERENIRQRSEGAASTFQLGQSAEDNISGQGDIFSKPVIKSGKEQDNYASAYPKLHEQINRVINSNPPTPESRESAILMLKEFLAGNFNAAADAFDKTEELVRKSGIRAAPFYFESEGLSASLRNTKPSEGKSRAAAGGEAESKASFTSEQDVAGVAPGQPAAAPQIIALSEVKNNTKIELDGKTYKAKKLLDAANKRVERFKALLECVR